MGQSLTPGMFYFDKIMLHKRKKCRLFRQFFISFCRMCGMYEKEQLTVYQKISTCHLKILLWTVFGCNKGAMLKKIIINVLPCWWKLFCKEETITNSNRDKAYFCLPCQQLKWQKTSYIKFLSKSTDLYKKDFVISKSMDWSFLRKSKNLKALHCTSFEY